MEKLIAKSDFYALPKPHNGFRKGQEITPEEVEAIGNEAMQALFEKGCIGSVGSMAPIKSEPKQEPLPLDQDEVVVEPKKKKKK